ncbi:MAG: hypothetical protein GY804_06190 [Alphaproteobacteria bacterium]|nr:hypothetical protein [Alphaproteobacteria bacterium]
MALFNLWKQKAGMPEIPELSIIEEIRLEPEGGVELDATEARQLELLEFGDMVDMRALFNSSALYLDGYEPDKSWKILLAIANSDQGKKTMVGVLNDMAICIGQLYDDRNHERTIPFDEAAAKLGSHTAMGTVSHNYYLNGDLLSATKWGLAYEHSQLSLVFDGEVSDERIVSSAGLDHNARILAETLEKEAWSDASKDYTKRTDQIANGIIKKGGCLQEKDMDSPEKIVQSIAPKLFEDSVLSDEMGTKWWHLKSIISDNNECLLSDAMEIHNIQVRVFSAITGDKNINDLIVKDPSQLSSWQAGKDKVSELVVGFASKHLPRCIQSALGMRGREGK